MAELLQFFQEERHSAQPRPDIQYILVFTFRPDNSGLVAKYYAHRHDPTKGPPAARKDFGCFDSMQEAVDACQADYDQLPLVANPPQGVRVT